MDYEELEGFFLWPGFYGVYRILLTITKILGYPKLACHLHLRLLDFNYVILYCEKRFNSFPEFFIFSEFGIFRFLSFPFSFL